MKKIFALVIVLLLASGCTHTREIVKHQSRSQYFESMNSYLKDVDEVYVYLNDSTFYTASKVTIDQDNCKFINKASASYISLPTTQIMKIQKKNYTMGFLEGTCLGGLVPMLLGGALGASLSHGGGQLGGLDVLFSAGIGFAIGTVGGAAYGIIEGSTNEYIIPQDSVTVTPEKLPKKNPFLQK